MTRLTMALAALTACSIAACGSTSTTITKTVTKSVEAVPLSTSTSTTAREVQTVTTVTRPPCPRLTFGVDGNAGPVTCTIDNPAALHYFARWVDPLLKLGPDATPEQVAHQLQSIANQSSGPITCSVYALAQRAEGWHFAMSPTGGVTEDC